jgi:16S rRNA (adenine1518-N6/adenine1519-N6)-dimethyltransferase
VDSAVVRVIPLAPEQRHDADQDRVHAVVKAAFAQRRKTLGNALRQLMDAPAIEAAGVDPKARAETLAPADFVRLAKAMPSG